MPCVPCYGGRILSIGYPFPRNLRNEISLLGYNIWLYLRKWETAHTTAAEMRVSMEVSRQDQVRQVSLLLLILLNIFEIQLHVVNQLLLFYFLYLPILSVQT